MDKRTPHEARLAAREYPYPNVMAEREAHREIDRAVFDRVRQYERLLVERAEEFKGASKDRVSASLDVIERIRVEVLEPIRNGAPLTPELAQRYEVLAQQAGEARAAVAESEWHEKRCADPYGDYENVMSKWPILRPSL